MKFEFSYEKLLDHRKTVEEVAHRDYLLAQTQVDAAEKVLRGMYDDIAKSRTRIGKLEVEGGKAGPALGLLHDFIDGQKIRIERQRAKIRELLAEAERKHEILVEAAREHKTLQKLKEKRKQEFRKAVKKRELKAVDEIVTTRFKRGET